MWMLMSRRQSGIWERISRWKVPTVEPRDSSLFPDAIADFAAKLDQKGSHGGARGLHTSEPPYLFSQLRRPSGVGFN